MAMSLSRPDSASPAQVADASFSTGRRGFDQNEVRDFLGIVSAELSRLRERESSLERELHSAQNNPDFDKAQLDDEALTRLLGEETARVLNAARESAHEIREKAEQSAARILLEASDEATRMREEAEIEASRRRSDAAADVEAELSMAKQQGREMVTEARAYRERVLSELARRRELAREQIEQLVHGRDRLMQVFERARLVAVDVVAEMQPLGEPDEYVNLQPSTGPVPVMVAREAPVPHDQDGNDDSEAAEQGVAPEVGQTSDADTSVPSIPLIQSTDDDLRMIDVEETDSTAVADDSPSPNGAALISDVEPADRSEPAGVEESTGSAGVEESTGIEESAGSEEPGAPAADESDDVVVDLFARLRADATEGVSDPALDTDDEPVVSVGDAPNETTDATHTPGTDTDTPTPDTQATETTEASTDDEQGESTVFDQRNADLTPLIVASARKLKRMLADEQNEVLDALRRNDPVRSLDALLPWATEHTDRYAAVIGDDLLLAANAGASLANSEKTPKLRKAAGRDAVAEASQKLGQWLVQPLRDRLERCVVDGDGDNATITKKVRAVYRECKTRHIDEQLDDVVRVAHGRGQLAAIGLDVAVEWTPDPGHAVCADCDDNRLAGAVASGQSFPTGQECPPAHPGCRCTLVPVRR